MVLPLLVQKAAAMAGISANLLFSVCSVETGMRTVNSFHDGHGRGSLGMCQISVEVARSFRPEADRLALQQPGFNLLVSAMYLKQLQTRYNNNTHHSIAAYNAGYAYIQNGQYRNQLYVNKVMKVMGRL